VRFDPGLQSDKCIYAEAIAGDGGVHEPTAAWWVSPDILLNDSGLTLAPGTTTPGEARIGTNAIGVRVHKTAECVVPPASTLVLIDLFAATPTPGYSPANSTNIGSDAIAPAGLTPLGTVKQFSPDWTPSTNPSDPDGPGHKCLVARVYPDILTPDGNDFHLPDDPHVVQRNICIQPCSMLKSAPGEGGEVGVLGPDRRHLWVFAMELFNPGRRPEIARLSAWADTAPPKHVLEAAAPRLSSLDARPSDQRPQAISLATRRGKGRKVKRGFNMAVSLEPGRRTPLALRVDLRNSSRGEAHFVHVTQSSDRRRSIGGCTVVFVMLDDGP
jgi:hypothetical protein